MSITVAEVKFRIGEYLGKNNIHPSTSGYLNVKDLFDKKTNLDNKVINLIYQNLLKLPYIFCYTSEIEMSNNKQTVILNGTKYRVIPYQIFYRVYCNYCKKYTNCYRIYYYISNNFDIELPYELYCNHCSTFFEQVKPHIFNQELYKKIIYDTTQHMLCGEVFNDKLTLEEKYKPNLIKSSFTNFNEN